MIIPFNKPFLTGKELHYISQAHQKMALAGDGSFTKRCHQWLKNKTGSKKALLTHSCTAALEMSAILANIEPGDEVIMPSYTFVSTANAFVLRGGIPVFVDIREDTLNLNENIIEEAVTDKTKAIIPVHYAGVGCEMDTILQIAKSHKLVVIEDAAQGLMATYKGTPLGSMGTFGTLSFHETKNVISGEGGALLVNDPNYTERAEIIREKGTNRSQFFRGEVDKYTWQDIGSSFLPGEIVAAFLFAQLEQANEITAERISQWNAYHNGFETLEKAGCLRRPIIPSHCKHNAHMYYILVGSLKQRTELIEYLGLNGINSVFHYIPLHDSPAGKKFCKQHGDLNSTTEISERIVRLPLWPTFNDHKKVIDIVTNFFN
ncbi:MAG: dTDP-4-amino-4,6-dideoxygalactose transaminase [Desulfuromonas sp.]|nr:MAG: dTDP-4-amino-4,6-dideoxygalactose transaminase [Desulfuromonas sp.]